LSSVSRSQRRRTTFTIGCELGLDRRGNQPALAGLIATQPGYRSPAINTVAMAILGWGISALASGGIFMQLLVMLGRGGFDRGRDSLFAAAACLVDDLL